MDDLVEGFLRLTATDDQFTGPVNLGNPALSVIVQGQLEKLFAEFSEYDTGVLCLCRNCIRLAELI